MNGALVWTNVDENEHKKLVSLMLYQFPPLWEVFQQFRVLAGSKWTRAHGQKFAKVMNAYHRKYIP